MTSILFITGGPLIQAAEDNAKGFFERVDVVLQNDYIMRKQKVHYAMNTHKYNAFQGLKDVLADMTGSFFDEGMFSNCVQQLLLPRNMIIYSTGKRHVVSYPIRFIIWSYLLPFLFLFNSITYSYT